MKKEISSAAKPRGILVRILTVIALHLALAALLTCLSLTAFGGIVPGEISPAALLVIILELAVLTGFSTFLILLIIRPDAESLKYELTAAGQENKALTQLLSQVAPQATEQLFQAIISGTPIDAEQVGALLESVGSPYRATGRYTVVIFHLETVNGDNTDCKAAWFTDLSRDFWRNQADVLWIHQPVNQLVAVLHFSSDCSAARIKSTLETFARMLSSQADSKGYDVFIGSGRICTGLGELRAVYMEARDNLARVRHYRESRESDSEGKDISSIANYTNKARQMVQLALDGNRDWADHALKLINEISASYGTPQDVSRMFRHIHGVLLNEMVKYHVDISDMAYDNVISITEGDGRSVEQAMLDFCSMSLNLLGNVDQKRLNRHVENAKKYIEDHYTDSGLSLEQVSAYTGVSTSYLSKMFTEKLDQGFLDYLNLYRVEKAKELLLGTGLTISQVGNQVGFSSAQSFIRVFKKYTGITPGRFAVEMHSDQ